VTREAGLRRQDILDAVARCLDYQPHLISSDPAIAAMAYDAVLRNLAVIGEAVRVLPANVKVLAPTVPWASIAGLRNVVVHEYFRVDAATIVAIVQNDLILLADALRAMADG
jgi:uncharacterized protein with HEPN domain